MTKILLIGLLWEAQKRFKVRKVLRRGRSLEVRGRLGEVRGNPGSRNGGLHRSSWLRQKDIRIRITTIYSTRYATIRKPDGAADCSSLREDRRTPGFSALAVAVWRQGFWRFMANFRHRTSKLRQQQNTRNLYNFGAKSSKNHLNQSKYPQKPPD